FFFVMYHQSPKRALNIVAAMGPDSNIDRLLAGALNEPILGQYRTRYQTAYDIIVSGDSSGVDTTPGTTPEPTPPDTAGDPGSGTGTVRPSAATDITYATQVGDALHMRRVDGSVLVLVPTGRGVWVPSADGSVGAVVPPPTPNPDPVQPPSGTASANQAALVTFVLAQVN